MELKIKDRLLIPTILPKEGTFTQFNLKMSILVKLELSADEIKEFKLRPNDEAGMVEWDVRKEAPLVPMFPHEEMVYLNESCENNSDKALHDDVWTTIDVLYNAIQLAD